MSDTEKLRAKARRRGIGTEANGGYERHVLVCVGDSCAKKSDNAATLKQFRREIKGLEKDGHNIYCTPVECLQLCKGGPLVVVYHEGTWYHDISPEDATRIAQEHLGKGKPVEEFAFATNPLSPRPSKKNE